MVTGFVLCAGQNELATRGRNTGYTYTWGKRDTGETHQGNWGQEVKLTTIQGKTGLSK